MTGCVVSISKKTNNFLCVIRERNRIGFFRTGFWRHVGAGKNDIVRRLGLLV